jgi:hypothetical protein
MGRGALNGNGNVLVRQRHSRVQVIIDPHENKPLTWPQDARRIARLPLPEFQSWIASIDPRSLIFLAQNREFERFLFWHYLLPVRFFRFLLKLKIFFRGVFFK